MCKKKGGDTVRKYGSMRKRDQKLEQVRAGRKGKLSCAKKKVGYLDWYIIRRLFRIRNDMKTSWGLSIGGHINVTYDIAHGTHPHRYTRNCSADNDGRKLGIMISKIVNGAEQRHLVTKDTVKGAQEYEVLNCSYEAISTASAHVERLARPVYTVLSEDLKSDDRVIQVDNTKLAFDSRKIFTFSRGRLCTG